MTLYITEAEMLERYIDGLKKSASRAGEFLTATKDEKFKLFVDFIDGIKVAAGSAHQLYHAQVNPKWLDTRDILESVISFSIGITDYTDEESGPIWLVVQKTLNDMIDTGKKLATMKSMKWEDVDSNLIHRASVADKLN